MHPVKGLPLTENDFAFVRSFNEQIKQVTLEIEP